MNILIIVLQGLMILGIPLLILHFRNTKAVRLLGMIGTTYLAGIVLALIIFALNTAEVTFSLNKDVGEIGSYVAIAVAIPLLLFNANLKEAAKLSRLVGRSMLSLVLSLLVVTTACVFAFRNSLSDVNVLGGMAMGLYTGGTPNLNAIGSAFAIGKEAIALANLSDVMIGGVFYIFLLVAAKPFLDLFLKKYRGGTYLTAQSRMVNYEALESVPLKQAKGVFFSILLALLMAVASALGGVVLWYLMGAQEGEMFTYLVPVLLIGVTVFGLIASFNKSVRQVKGTNLVGQYLILVFSFALSSCLDLSGLGDRFLHIFLFFAIITVGTFLVHILFSRLLKVETDCTIVVLTAGVYGPAFVPAVAKQLKNNDLIVPGLIVGSVGYAVGTFLGIGMGLLFGLLL